VFIDINNSIGVAKFSNSDQICKLSNKIQHLTKNTHAPIKVFDENHHHILQKGLEAKL
jgi:hypothetical protein